MRALGEKTTVFPPKTTHDHALFAVTPIFVSESELLYSLLFDDTPEYQVQHDQRQDQTTSVHSLHA